MANKSVRSIAIEILEKIEKDSAFSNLVLDREINDNELAVNDANLLTELVYGVIQRKRALDFLLEPFLKKQKKLDNWVLQTLRVSAYQLAFLDRIPDYAVLNEAVDYAKKRGHKGTSSLVNGVLRNFQRNSLRSYDEIDGEVEKLAIEHSFPNWMVEDFIKQYGYEETTELLVALNTRPKVSIRVNTKHISVDDALEQLEDEGYELVKSEISSAGLVLQKGSIVKSKLFKEGLITVQDESSQLVAEVLNARPSDKVLDACAAPGGKTTHIANYLKADVGGGAWSSDIHKKKVKLIEENVERQNLKDVVQVRQLDAKKAGQEYEKETFDKILIDAPCSGLGLMRRKPDIRYTKTPDDIANLQKVQLDILEETADLLKDGGRLVYSTCTILDTENEQVVELFLDKHPEFTLEPIKVNSLASTEGNKQVLLLPHQHQTDGFFIASLVKNIK